MRGDGSPVTGDRDALCPGRYRNTDADLQAAQGLWRTRPCEVELGGVTRRFRAGMACAPRYVGMEWKRLLCPAECFCSEQAASQPVSDQS